MIKCTSCVKICYVKTYHHKSFVIGLVNNILLIQVNFLFSLGIILQFSTDEALCPEQAPVCDGVHRLLHLLWSQCSCWSGRQDLNKRYRVLWIKSSLIVGDQCLWLSWLNCLNCQQINIPTLLHLYNFTQIQET